MKKEKRYFTKQEIKSVVKLWKDTSLQDIAKELKMTVIQVAYLAQSIRKAGHKLPKKRKIGQLNFMVKEAMRELVEDKEWDEENYTK